MAVADTTAPVLTSLTFPTAVDVTGGNRTVSVSIGATDQGAGIDFAFVNFKRSWQGTGGADDQFYFTDTYGDSFSDGVSTASEFINAASGAGTYEIDRVSIRDKAGNFRFYYTPELTSLGFQTSFTIIDRNVAPTATINAPASVAEDGATGISLSLTLANVAQASGTVTMSFAAAQSTATNGIDISVPAYSSNYSVLQSPAGSYTLTLPSISIIKDQVAEGTETVAVTIRAAGQIFDTGTDTKTISIKLIDSGQNGTAGADTLMGTKFNDELSGLSGNDTLNGGLGDDRLFGGLGSDTAVFSGVFRQASVTITSEGAIVIGADGTDTATGVERFQFVDGIYVIDPDSTGAQVQRLYDTVLGRAPDVVGLDYWVDRMEDAGVGLDQVALALASSAEFQGATGGLGNTAFVDYVYNRALGRAPDSGGRDYWTARLDAGLSRGDMLVSFSESTEHQARTAALVNQGYFHSDDTAQAVALLYDSFAGRRPDSDGLTFWTGQVKSGNRTLAQVADGFAASAEFADATRGMVNAQIVNFMYQNTLDRAPDEGGRVYWVDQLDRGLTQGQLLLSFSQSAEHAQLMASHIVYGVDVLG